MIACCQEVLGLVPAASLLGVQLDVNVIQVVLYAVSRERVGCERLSLLSEVPNNV